MKPFTEGCTFGSRIGLLGSDTSYLSEQRPVATSTVQSGLTAVRFRVRKIQLVESAGRQSA